MLRVIAASHQCGSGSNPGVDAIMWVEFARSLLCYERFFSGNFDFPLSSKSTFSNTNSIRNLVDDEPLN